MKKIREDGVDPLSKLLAIMKEIDSRLEASSFYCKLCGYGNAAIYDSEPSALHVSIRLICIYAYICADFRRQRGGFALRV